jgi:short-subunit dehydrogenase
MPNFALITGASQGLGEALAYEFAAAGIPVLLTARNELALRQVAAHIAENYGVEVRVFACDLTDPQGPNQLLRWVKKEKFTLDYLVNNAGFGWQGEFINSDNTRNAQMVQLNITSLISLTHQCLPQLIKNRGRILNIASTAAFQPGPYMAVYYATKAFVLHFSEALNAELKDAGVTVTALCPGPTATGFAKAAGRATEHLFKRVGTAPVQPVAALGFKAMMQGQAVAVYGLKNKLLTLLVRLLPRRVVTSVVAKISKP